MPGSQLLYRYEWGKLLSTTGSAANTIGAVNPLRYRGYYYDNETELYYLQSRYYDPEIGRFLNADAITDSGAGVLGYNIFAYAGNNPINYSDSTGHWIIKDAIKWATEKIAKPTNEFARKTFSKLAHGTRQVGITGSAFYGSGVTGAVGFAYDGQGNIGITVSYGAGVGFPSVSTSVFETVTTAPSIDKLNGYSSQIGISFDVSGASVGVEGTIFNDSVTDKYYVGSTTSIGLGIFSPLEVHSDETYTNVYYSINIFDVVDNVYKKIIDW